MLPPRNLGVRGGFSEWRFWDCITSCFSKWVWSLLHGWSLGNRIVMRPCFLLVRHLFSPCWVYLPKTKTIKFLGSWRRKLFQRLCWLKPCVFPLAERRFEFDFHMQLHACLSLALLFRTLHLFIFAFWIAFLQWITIPQDLWWFFSD